MEFCDNKQQLFQAYFREFKIEQMSSPYKAFQSGWHAEISAKKLGINSSYIIGDYSYVLVRVSRFRERAKLRKPIAPNQPIEASALEKIRNVTVGNTVSVLQFIEKYGSHYINSYVTGNSLYQVRANSLMHMHEIMSIDMFFFFFFSLAVGVCVQQTKL
jgi:torso-like protein